MCKFLLAIQKLQAKIFTVMEIFVILHNFVHQVFLVRSLCIYSFLIHILILIIENASIKLQYLFSEIFSEQEIE